MELDELARSERIDETIENARKAQRRERALLRAPVTQPSGFPAKDIRRIAAEVKDDILRRG